MTKYLEDKFLDAVTDEFLKRNSGVLAEVQLQFSKAELWFAREFSLAMNQVLKADEQSKIGFTETGLENADISIWTFAKGEQPKPEAFFEVKAFNSSREKSMWKGIGQKAWVQTRAAPTKILHNLTGHGLFYLVLEKQTKTLTQQDQDTFLKAALDAIGCSFKLKAKRELLLATATNFGESDWATASWVVWGSRK